MLTTYVHGSRYLRKGEYKNAVWELLRELNPRSHYLNDKDYHKHIKRWIDSFIPRLRNEEDADRAHHVDSIFDELHPRSRYKSDRDYLVHLRQVLFARGWRPRSEISSKRARHNRQVRDREAEFSMTYTSTFPPPYSVQNSWVGEGRFGRVRSVSSTLTGKGDLAQKEFTLQNQNEQIARQKWMDEANIMLRLNHRSPTKHITKYVDAYDIDGDVLHIIMQPFANDGNLAKLLERAQADPAVNFQYTQILWRSIGCLTVALASLHEEGIYHQDLHPGNVLLHDGEVLLTDFGSSILNHRNNFQDFVAPELSVSPVYGVRTDCYGLGQLLYKMYEVMNHNLKSHYALLENALSRGSTTLAAAAASGLHRRIMVTIMRLKETMPEERMSARQAAQSMYGMFQEGQSILCSECLEWIRERTDRHA